MMGISRFIVGVLTIAFGLFLAGRLAPVTLDMAKNAAVGVADHSSFRLGSWSRHLNRSGQQ